MPGPADLTQLDLRRRFGKEITEGKPGQALARLQHTVADAGKFARHAHASDFSDDAPSDCLGLRVGEHARFRQHQRRVWLPVSRDGDGRDVAQGVYVVVLSMEGGGVHRDPTGLVGQPSLAYEARTTVGWDRYEKIVLESRLPVEGKFASGGIHFGQFVQRV